MDLKTLRIRNLNKIITDQLNINSIRNKFDLLAHQVKENIDILMTSETKLDEYFPAGQFLINGSVFPSMNNKSTCFKSPDKLCIDLVLTKNLRSSQNSCAIETGLSDFHKLVVTVMRTTYKKIKTKNCYLSQLQIIM